MKYIFRNGTVIEHYYDGSIHLDEYQLKEGERWVTTTEENSPDGKGHHFVVNENGEITKGMGGWRPTSVENTGKSLIDTLHKLPIGQKVSIKALGTTMDLSKEKSGIVISIGGNLYKDAKVVSNTLDVIEKNGYEYINKENDTELEKYKEILSQPFQLSKNKGIGVHLSEKQRKQVNAILENAPKEMQHYLHMVFNGVPVVSLHSKKPACFKANYDFHMFDENTGIIMNIANDSDYHTFFHEAGHGSQYVGGGEIDIETLHKELKNFKNREDTLSYIKSLGGNERFQANLIDMYSAKYPNMEIGGHSTQYWEKDIANTSREAFAEIFQMALTDKEGCEKFRELCPKTYKRFMESLQKNDNEIIRWGRKMNGIA